MPQSSGLTRSFGGHNAEDLYLQECVPCLLLKSQPHQETFKIIFWTFKQYMYEVWPLNNRTGVKILQINKLISIPFRVLPLIGARGFFIKVVLQVIS
jgi:hypothetical protein